MAEIMEKEVQSTPSPAEIAGKSGNTTVKKKKRRRAIRRVILLLILILAAVLGFKHFSRKTRQAKGRLW